MRATTVLLLVLAGSAFTCNKLDTHMAAFMACRQMVFGPRQPALEACMEIMEPAIKPCDEFAEGSDSALNCVVRRANAVKTDVQIKLVSVMWKSESAESAK